MIDREYGDCCDDEDKMRYVEMKTKGAEPESEVEAIGA